MMTQQSQDPSPGYSLMHVPRTTKKGHRVAVIYKNSIKLTKQPSPMFPSFENMVLLLNTGRKCVRITTIYRPPTTSFIKFLKDFESYIDSLSTKNKVF